MIYKPFPLVNKDFLEELEARFPDTCPPIGSTIEDIYRKQGQISVTAFLRAQFIQQNLNILEK